MPVLREEMFGPVVWAMPFDDDLDRIARATDDMTYGLAASIWIWTRDLRLAAQAREPQAGTLWINTQNFGDPALPFGGYKQSGWGREMGFEASNSIPR